jgi:hypothetical protein
MFKPSTRHNIVPGAGPSGYSEVKLNGKGVGNGNVQPAGRYQYRLNLWVHLPSFTHPDSTINGLQQSSILARLYPSRALRFALLIGANDSYTLPPALDITLEEFETFAINRLRILSYIESLQHRSLPYAQFQTQLAAYLKQHLPLASNTARSVNLEAERRADEIGHWVLRLAFCRSYVLFSSCYFFRFPLTIFHLLFPWFLRHDVLSEVGR